VGLKGRFYEGFHNLVTVVNLLKSRFFNRKLNFYYVIWAKKRDARIQCFEFLASLRFKDLLYLIFQLIFNKNGLTYFHCIPKMRVEPIFVDYFFNICFSFTLIIFPNLANSFMSIFFIFPAMVITIGFPLTNLSYIATTSLNCNLS